MEERDLEDVGVHVAEIPTAPKTKDPRTDAKYNPFSRVLFW